MKSITSWASLNPWKARIIITICHILIPFFAFFTGVLLFFLDWAEPPFYLHLFINLFFLAYVFYPIKGKKDGVFHYTYNRRRAHDFILVVSYSLFIVLGTNRFLTGNNNEQATVNVKSELVAFNETFNQNPAALNQKKKFNLKEKRKALKKRIKAEFRKLKIQLKENKEKKRNTALIGLGKAFATLLTIGAILALGYLVAVLACSLSCSGHEGAALAVLILGWGGLIFLGIVLIRAIFKRRNNE